MLYLRSAEDKNGVSLLLRSDGDKLSGTVISGELLATASAANVSMTGQVSAPVFLGTLTATASSPSAAAEGSYYPPIVTGTVSATATRGSASIQGDQLAIFTVSFSAVAAQSGTVPPSYTAEYGTEQTAPLNPGSLQRADYNFLGWSLTPTGPVVSTFTVNGTTVLYAKWQSTNSSLSELIRRYAIKQESTKKGVTVIWQ